MRAVQVETTIEEDGNLHLEKLPFEVGERVDVIVLARTQEKTTSDPYPLRGQPLRYERPTDPVAEQDWEVLR